MWAVAVAAVRPHEPSGVYPPQCWSVLRLPCDPQLRLPNSGVRLVIVRHPHIKPTFIRYIKEERKVHVSCLSVSKSSNVSGTQCSY